MHFRSRWGPCIVPMHKGVSCSVRVTALYALATLVCVVGCISADGERDLSTMGVEYRLQELHDPRPNRVHILRVDLSLGKVEPVVVVAEDPDGDGPIDAALTIPLELASGPSVLAFVNSNPWEAIPDAEGEFFRKWYVGQPVDIIGLAASGGHTRSHAERGAVSVWVNAEGRAFLSAEVPGDGTVVEGTAGFLPIVTDGTVVDPPGGDPHPRTAIGLDRNGTTMWLVVVDGRRKNYSEGMNFHELGSFMRGLGCWDAANMDGGGSSIMGVAGTDGSLFVVNNPSDRWLWLRRIRPLPTVLTIRNKQDAIE